MDIHQQADEIVATAMPDTILANKQEHERTGYYIDRAMKMQHDKGHWEFADVQSVRMTDPISGVSSVQFWFILLVDKERRLVKGEIFIETRD
jgi:hypothetical protein